MTTTPNMSNSNSTDSFTPPEQLGTPGIDPRSKAKMESEPTPYNIESFERIGVTAAWRKFADRLTWGKGQTLAIIDDGCDMTVPEWNEPLPWDAPKVVATWNVFDDNDDPTPVPPGYHGTTVGYPSSLNYRNACGIAFNDNVIHIRGVTVVHLKKDESKTIAKALNWVLDNRHKHHITAVNLSPVDDQEHDQPVPSAIDAPLQALREAGVWVSAPCANHGYVGGISWPACQPFCHAIGATKPETGDVYLDRHHNTDLLVAAAATSSSNAYACAAFMVTWEAIQTIDFPWRDHGATPPEAIMALFQKHGNKTFDPELNRSFDELNLLATLNAILEP